MAIRSLGFDRAHFVGAASMVSLVNDLAKTAVFTKGELLDASAWMLVGIATPLMVAVTVVGRRLNRSLTEPASAGLFWTVMVG